MKRTHEVPEKFTLRDPGGRMIQAARVAGAKRAESMNTYILRLIHEDTDVRAGWKEERGER